MKLPALFLGHGNPLDLFDTSIFTTKLKKIGIELKDNVKAVLFISAHWQTRGTFITASSAPEQIYDFYGFPDELYNFKYHVKGSEEIAKRILDTIKVGELDYHHGLDHGVWTLAARIFPDAEIPVISMSVDMSLGTSQYYELGKKLKKLRSEGVLIIGSGNIVHNLRYIVWEKSFSYDWALEFHNYIKTNVLNKDFSKVLDYKTLGKSANLSVPTPEHFVPILYVLGAIDSNDTLVELTGSVEMGSLSTFSFIAK